MASNPTPAACMKCGTPHVPGAAFCGTCGTPAGSPGMPPPQPPMPPRPLTHGARQVVVPMNQPEALQAAAGVLPRVKGEVTNQSPMQIAFRMGGFINGRVTGTVDAYQEGQGRTALNVTMKADYGSLVPGVLVALAAGIIFYVVAQQSAYNAQVQAIWNPYGGYQGAGIGSFLQPWMIFLLIVLGAGLSAWLLGGPMLDKRRMALLNALQSLSGMAPGIAPQAAAPQLRPAAPGVAPQGQAAPPPVTPFEQLRKLAELRDSGAISPDDYEQAKAAIIAKMS